ncbi:MAG: hypothetical protein MUE56_08600 [Ignavibacteria bacterium]|jgi:predicted Fe-Mo cluster-binding NifX family protein|nr:hypothetical protein [Ignavibacteria bacterium]
MKNKLLSNLTAIAVKEADINTKLEECFGKSEYFFIADPENKNFEFVKNPGLDSVKMSGRRAALFLARNKITTVISSNFGASVKKVFDKNKIRLVILSPKYKLLKDIEWVRKLI